MGNLCSIGVLCLAKKALLAWGRVLEYVDVAPMALTVSAVEGLGWMAAGPIVFTVSLKMPHLTRVFQPTRRSVSGLFLVTNACIVLWELLMVRCRLVVPIIGIRSPETLKIQ